MITSLIFIYQKAKLWPAYRIYNENSPNTEKEFLLI